MTGEQLALRARIADGTATFDDAASRLQRQGCYSEVDAWVIVAIIREVAKLREQVKALTPNDCKHSWVQMSGPGPGPIACRKCFVGKP